MRIIHAKEVMLGILAKIMMTVLAIITAASLIQRDFNGKCVHQPKNKALNVNLIKNAKII